MNDSAAPRASIRRRSAHLANSNRLTADEAQRLADADGATRTETLGTVRARHLRERLADAVRLRLISAADVGRLAAQVQANGHNPELRRIVNDLVDQVRTQAGRV